MVEKNFNKENKDSTKDKITPEQEEVLKSTSIPDSVDVKIKTLKSISKDAIDMNNAFQLSELIYKDVLSPQLQENEILKREHKKSLMKKLFSIIKWQFIATYTFILILLICIMFSEMLKISESVVLVIIKFLEFYISSIIVELIAILFFIVKNVFDKSIVELIKNFDKR